jgi:hypothetical protein
MLFPLFLVISLSGVVAQKASVMVREEVSYRVLDRDSITLPDGSTKLGYAVSVDHLLDRTMIEKLICQLLATEKPPTFSLLAVTLYHKLDEYHPTGGLPNLEAELRDHYLANYIWNVKIPEATDRLTILRGVEGNVLSPPQGYNFDHTKTCASPQ